MAAKSRKGARTSTRRVEWLSSPGRLGQEAVTTANAIEVAKQEIGPCYSRWADDCLSKTEESLREHGLFARCQRLIQAMDAATVEDWNDYIEGPEAPFCEGYYDYSRMPNGYGQGTGTSKPKKKSSSNAALAVGASVAVIGLALAAIA